MRTSRRRDASLLLGNEDEVNFLNISALNITRNRGGYCPSSSISEKEGILFYKGSWRIKRCHFQNVTGISTRVQKTICVYGSDSMKMHNTCAYMQHVDCNWPDEQNVTHETWQQRKGWIECLMMDQTWSNILQHHATLWMVITQGVQAINCLVSRHFRSSNLHRLAGTLVVFVADFHRDQQHRRLPIENLRVWGSKQA